MSEMAETLLAQGSGFLKAGQPARAVELLERALLLARGNDDLRQSILSELYKAYERTGEVGKAARCRVGPVSSADPGVQDLVDEPVAVRRRYRGILILVATHLLAATLAAMVGWSIGQRHGSDVVLAQTGRPTTGPTTRRTLRAVSAPGSAPAAAPGVAPVPTVTLTPRRGAGRAPARVPASTTPMAAATQPAASLMPPREQMLSECVGMLVVMLRYDGVVNGTPTSFQIPVSSGTAFVIAPGDVVVTTRSAVESGDESTAPSTLAEAGMPLVMLRARSYWVCFPAKGKVQYPATLTYKSGKNDLALLKMDTAVPRSLKLTSARVSNLQQVAISGYSSIDIPSGQDAAKHANSVASGTNPVANLPLHQAHLELQQAVVGARERNVKGVSYAQIDSADPSELMGGAILNDQDEIVGMTVKSPEGAPAGHRYALLMEQVKDELAGHVPTF